MYYNDRYTWVKMNYRSMSDMTEYFKAARMADEYYTKLYNYKAQ